MSKKLTLGYCQNIARQMGGACLSNIYVNVKSRLRWECENNHIWETSLDSIKNCGTWCPKCYYIKLSEIKTLSNGLELAKQIAKNNGGVCLSSTYASTRTKMIWRCNVGHIWKTSLTKIKDDKSWCPYCANNKNFSIDIAVEIARLNGGKCLSKEYINCDTGLLWECKNGHQWETPLYNIKNRDSWCSICRARTSKGQIKLTNVIKNIYKNMNILTNYRGFSWLITDKNKRQEIDIFVPKIKLAVEYDGEQHFNLVTFGGISVEKAITNLERTKKLDIMKNENIENKPNDVKYFIRFNYRENITKEYVIEKLILNNIPIGV